ncbi:MAG: hypothetical protein OT477_15730 [Chloroflexi bacterium]|nr:hypothetical protein [Chloroflexota bacterium]
MSMTPTQQLAKIRQMILTQEGLRDFVPAEQLEAILASLRQQEQTLLAQLGGEPATTYGANAVHVEGSTVQGNVIGGSGNSVVNTGGGDYVARDKVTNVTGDYVAGQKVTGDQYNAQNIHFYGQRGPDPDPSLKLPPAPPNLHHQMVSYLSKSDINTICFYLNVDYDRLEGETLDDKVTALIIYCRRHNRVADLLKACAERNPSRQWG